jgi:4-methylaminobutanoate oxidase (formaldehyde-forming)
VLLGYVERRDGGTADREWLRQGTYQVAVGGQRYDADLTIRPPFDPAGMRIRA